MPSKLDEFHLKSRVLARCGFFRGTQRNTDGRNQEVAEDHSQSDEHAEVMKPENGMPRTQIRQRNSLYHGRCQNVLQVRIIFQSHWLDFLNPCSIRQQFF